MGPLISCKNSDLISVCWSLFILLKSDQSRCLLVGLVCVYTEEKEGLHKCSGWWSCISPFPVPCSFMHYSEFCHSCIWLLSFLKTSCGLLWYCLTYSWDIHHPCNFVLLPQLYYYDQQNLHTIYEIPLYSARCALGFIEWPYLCLR